MYLDKGGHRPWDATGPKLQWASLSAAQQNWRNSGAPTEGLG